MAQESDAIVLAVSPVRRLQSRCPSCRSDEVITHYAGGAVWKECDLCWAMWGPLEESFANAVGLIGDGQSQG